MVVVFICAVISLLTGQNCDLHYVGTDVVNCCLFMFVINHCLFMGTELYLLSVSAAVFSQDRNVIVSTFCWHRCGELLSAVQSLATHENSLRIQAMQAHK